MSEFPRLQEALARCINKRLTFATFRLPGQPVRLWVQREPVLGTAGPDELTDLEQAFITAPFLLDPGRIPYVRADLELLFPGEGPGISALNDCVGGHPGTGGCDAPTSRQEFLDTVRAAKETCARAGLRKVVLSRVKHADIPSGRWPELFAWALDEAPDTLVALCHTPEHGLWMGASPERLVKAVGDHVRADSIAATRPADAVPPTVQDWGPKELDEQAQVTTYLKELFAAMQLEEVDAEGPSVLRAGPVAHLHTVLRARLGSLPLIELVTRLHPTPAVCGVPAEDARRFILSREKHDRSLYTGFWGPWNLNGATELFVNLRCMRHVAGQTQLLVGAGITAGSDAEMEWEETERKARTWLRALETSAQVN